MERRRRRSELKATAGEQISQLEMSIAGRITQLETQKSSVQDQMSGVEQALREIPPGHPKRGEYEKALNNLRRFLSGIEAQINSLKFRQESQKRMINFRATMQEKMLMIKFSDQKSLILRQFAERIMQIEANQAMLQARQQMAAGNMGKGKAGAPKDQKEMGSASG
jgi:hypothetical protein